MNTTHHHNTPFMGRDPASTSPPWKEWAVQAYIVQELRRMGYVVHGDGNGLSLTPKGRMMKSVTGGMAGWPDLCILLDGGKTLWVELKMSDGRISKEQKELAERMVRLGHICHVVWADCPATGLELVMRVIEMAKRRCRDVVGRVTMCDECGKYPGDPKICPGCEAYKDHTS